MSSVNVIDLEARASSATALHQAEFFPANQADARAVFDRLRSDRQMWQITAKILFDEAQQHEAKIRELEARNAALLAQLQAERQAKRIPAR